MIPRCSFCFSCVFLFTDSARSGKFLWGPEPDLREADYKEIGSGSGQRCEINPGVHRPIVQQRLCNLVFIDGCMQDPRMRRPEPLASSPASSPLWRAPSMGSRGNKSAQPGTFGTRGRTAWPGRLLTCRWHRLCFFYHSCDSAIISFREFYLKWYGNYGQVQPCTSLILLFMSSLRR
jgi:hypothetical protein